MFDVLTRVVIVSAYTRPIDGTARIARLNTRGEHLRGDVTRPAAERVRVAGCVRVLQHKRSNEGA